MLNSNYSNKNCDICLDQVAGGRFDFNDPYSAPVPYQSQLGIEDNFSQSKFSVHELTKSTENSNSRNDRIDELAKRKTGWEANLATLAAIDETLKISEEESRKAFILAYVKLLSRSR